MEYRENAMGEAIVQAVVVEPAEAAPVGRRELAALVGALVGLAATGCAADGQGEKPMEELGQVAEALSGTALRWVDTVLGAAPPNARTGDLATKNSANLGNAIVVIAKACVAAGDGGGGVFYWESTSGGDDGGTIIVPSVGGGRWVRIYSGPLDVRWFGASPTSSDNSDAIQAAIKAASTAGGVPAFGGVVYVPPGTYTTAYRPPNATDPGAGFLLANVTLVGAGPRRSFLRLKDGVNQPILYTSGVDNCGIRDLGFEGNNANQSGGDFQPVKFNNCNDLHIENILILRGVAASKGVFGPSAGLYITTCLRFRLLNVEVTGNGAGDGIQVINSAKFELVNPYVHDMAFYVSGASNDQLEGISLDSCEEWTMVNPRVHDLSGNIAGARFTRGIQLSGCKRFSIVGGHIARVDQGIDLTGKPNVKWEIGSVITQECLTYGIKCANWTSDGLVDNCTADRSGIAGFVVSPPSGEDLGDESSDIQFVNCVAYDSGYTSAVAGPRVGFLVFDHNYNVPPYPYTGTTLGVRFIGCKAHDRQLTPTMQYGFLNQVPAKIDGRYNEAINCVSLRHTVAARSGIHASHCEVGRAATQSIPNNAWTVVDWTTHVDDGAMHDTASANSNVYGRRPGTYSAQFGVVFAPNGVGQRGARILLNGNVVPGTTILSWPGAGGQTSVLTSTIRRMDSGANFRIEVFQDSGGPLNLQTTSAGVVEQVA